VLNNNNNNNNNGSDMGNVATFFGSQPYVFKPIIKNGTIDTLYVERPSVPLFMRNYDYDVSRTPMLLPRTRIDQFNNVITLLPKLIDKVINRFFGNDKKHFTDYLNVHELVYEVRKATSLDFAHLTSRYDASLTNDGLQLLEINVGSNIGGWQHDFIHHLVFEEPELRGDKQCWQYREVLNGFFKQAQSIFNSDESGKVRHVLMSSSNYKGQNKRNFEATLRKLINHGSQGQLQLTFYEDFNDIEFSEDDKAFYDGRQIDFVIFNFSEAVDEGLNGFMIRLCRCQKAGNLFFPDSPAYALFGNKLIFALLHEPEVLQMLEHEETHLIEQFVPWTAKFNSERLFYQGCWFPTEKLLSEHQQDLVLKKAHSMKGKDVVVGRFTQPQEWQTTYRNLSDDGDWIVQAYVDQKLDKLDAFEFVWGFFGFGEKYGGAFVRGSMKNANGVINSANGATEFIVFEEKNTLRI